jgi:tetrapyrrole methylase family protein/MazG family protein
MTKSSLIVVGVGIKFISHLSVEAKAYISQSDRVLYLINDPLMQDWIKQLNPSSESLDHLYTQHSLRIDCYKAISKYILETLHSYKHVCVVMYGHPSVFAQPALDAVKQAKKNGYFAKVLPAISAEDCLFADLLIDPGSCGCQSFEATDFLIHRRQFDTQSHLVLWQVGVIGALTHVKNFTDTNGISVLTNYLEQFYSPHHPVIAYEAAQYPSFDPRIEEVELKQLANTTLSRITTLYVPPLGKALCDKDMLLALNIDIEDLQ